MINYRPLRVFAKRKLGLLQGKFTYFNTKVYFPKNSLIFRIACDEGIYDKDVFYFIFTFLKENSLFIDIGTNIGLLSVPVLHNFKCTKVISFEPSATVLPYLMRTYGESAHQSRWTIYNTALGDYTGNVLFEKNQDIDSAFDSIVRENTDKSNKEIETVQITTIDELLKVPENEFATIVIKIDVEGFEFNVLKGGKKFIEKHKPVIVIEMVKEHFEKYQVSIRDMMALIHNMNYNIYGLSTLNRVNNADEFELSMIRNLNFALLPDNHNCS